MFLVSELEEIVTLLLLVVAEVTGAVAAVAAL